MSCKSRGSPGPARSIAGDLRDNKREFTKNFGATHMINATAENVLDPVRR